ncbi:unnamed protein product [Somion occarium]|uniref:FHA domain-containing protein n=1 Tax=Somion occarium TaxID=3059160 RepID=A0ABP1DQ39_9APHY
MPPFTPALSPVQLPALYLYPLNDSFIPKHISLVNNQRVKIGRQTNAKTVPAERNGYFDSKVLSRQHAEVWEESGKIFIKDVKSSNGTFINGERLSPEGLESEPFELKTDDVVEFGIDIVGEDNKTIIHHKVAARVVCVFTDQDAQAAARAEAQSASFSLNAATSGVGGAFNFASQAGANGAPGPQRRGTMQTQGLGMGGMGGSARAPGKNNLTFDHILSRLQGELQKSRETSNDLHSLSSAMNDIHETLGGNLPPNLPPYPQTLPPVVAAQSTQQPQPAESSQVTGSSTSTQDSTAALAQLQAQLHETQMSLASHVDKIRSLEGMLAEHEAIKQEVSSMRELMEERKREMELFRVHSQSPNHLRRHPSRMEEGGDGEYMHDEDDDARSVATVIPHELERVDEEDEEQMAAEEEEEERRRRRDELGRPRTPEPTGIDHSHLHAQSAPSSQSSATASSSALPDDLIHRMNTLTNQLENALELSRSLEAQHHTAQSTISQLESKVSTLESLVQATQAQVQAQSNAQQELVQSIEARQPSIALIEEERTRERESLTEMLNDWKKSVEGQWSDVREEWAEERDRLKRAREEFESRVQSVENGLNSTVTKVESGLASLTALQVQHQFLQPNGNAKINGGGLFTPPSPRSLSVASTRPRQRKRRPSSTRGRSHSRSLSPGSTQLIGRDHSPVSPVSNDDLSSPKSRTHRQSSWMTDDSGSDSESLPINGLTKPTDSLDLQKTTAGLKYPITPEPSLRDQPVTGLNPSSVVAEAKDPPKDARAHLNNLSALAGFLALTVAAAAVAWRVKSDGSV